MFHVKLNFTGNRRATLTYEQLNTTMQLSGYKVYIFKFQNNELTEGRIQHRVVRGRVTKYDPEHGDMLVNVERGEIKSLIFAADDWAGAFYMAKFFEDGLNPDMFNGTITGTTDMQKTADLREWLMGYIDA